LDNERSVNQLCALERRVARSGKDSVNHPDGGHDDLANVIAGLLVMIAGKPAAMVISDEMLARARMLVRRYGNYGQPVPVLGRAWMEPRR
jgi:hypothetical protein